MPYRHAWLMVLAVFPLIAVAFWPFYFSRLPDAKLSMHLHTATATAWFILLALQSWSIHNGRAGLHRTAGKTALALFPVFFMAGVWVLTTMARETAAGLNGFYNVYGTRLGAYDLVAHLTFAGLFYLALRHRRQVQLHARFMLATPLLLIGPLTARLVPLVIPGLMMRGPEDIAKFAASVHISNALTLVVALLLFAAGRKHGHAFLIVAAAAIAQSLTFETLGTSVAWRDSFFAVSSAPLAVLLLVSLGLAAALTWLGWTRGRPRQPDQTAPA